MRNDPLEYKAAADAALERAADRLRELLHDAAALLDPFPPFPGAFFSYGIEVDVPGLESPERGCVILAPDGELYEMRMGQCVPALEFDMADPVALRREELKPLDLPPRDYVAYAYEALRKVAGLLLERRGG